MDRKPSPLEIFMTEFMPAADAAAVEVQVAKIQEPPKVTALGDLRAPAYGNDPTELLKHRFLYRGAVCLLCGPTGVGKSALVGELRRPLAAARPAPTPGSIPPGGLRQKCSTLTVVARRLITMPAATC